MKIAMTFDQFKNQTGLDGKPDKRGGKIKKIDEVFKTYRDEFDGKPLNEKIALTASLFTVCKDWLKAKSTKSDYKERLFRPTTVNQNLLARRRVIKTVAEQCLEAMAAMDPGLLARSQFDQHKIDVLSQGSSRPMVKTLSGSYGHERETWVRSHKTVAIAGSGVEPNRHNSPSPKVRNKRFDELTIDEYEKIYKAANTGKVLYLKKSERLSRMFVVGDDGLLYSSATQALGHCGTNVPQGHQEMINRYFDVQRQLYMYAMDSYGNLISSQIDEGQPLDDRGVQFFNHSSFNSGREVTAAGLLLMQDGYLRWIDNNSGHYKPTKKNLVECIRMLANDEADLSQTVIGLGIYTPHLAGYQCFTAARLLEGGENAVPDLPNVQ